MEVLPDIVIAKIASHLRPHTLFALRAASSTMKRRIDAIVLDRQSYEGHRIYLKLLRDRPELVKLASRLPAYEICANDCTDLAIFTFQWNDLIAREFSAVRQEFVYTDVDETKYFFVLTVNLDGYETRIFSRVPPDLRLLVLHPQFEKIMQKPASKGQRLYHLKLSQDVGAVPLYKYKIILHFLKVGHAEPRFIGRIGIGAQDETWTRDVNLYVKQIEPLL